MPASISAARKNIVHPWERLRPVSWRVMAGQMATITTRLVTLAHSLTRPGLGLRGDSYAAWGMATARS